MDNQNIEVNTLADVDLSDMKIPGAVVYFDTKDHPRTFVARIWEMTKGKPTNIIITRTTLEDIREEMRAAGFNGPMPRAECDDPVIVETWI